MEWFVQIHKKIKEWGWYTDMATCKLFFHILLSANYKKVNWRWHKIQPWQFITSLDHLAIESWLSTQQVRTALDKLISTNEITKQSTSLYTILTLNNWETYNTPDNKPITNEQQTNNKPITTTNNNYTEYKENKEYNTEIVALQPNEYQISISYLKNIENEQIPEYAENYQDEWIKFCYYWSEKWRTWKIRAEWEKTFEIKRRFYNWLSREKVEYTKIQKPLRWIA